MKELNLQLDKKADESVNYLMNFYNLKSRADLITKAISFLKIAAHVLENHGEIFARRGDSETIIKMR